MKAIRIGVALGTFLALAVLFPTASIAFHKGSDGNGQEGSGDVSGDADFKETLRQREMERDQSRKNLEERERQRKNRQGKYIARIHATGDDPTSADGNEVVATLELSKEEYENQDFSRVHAAAGAHNRMSLMTGSAEAAAAPEPGATAKPSNGALPTNRTLLGLSLLLVAGGAWWVLRPRGTT